MLEKRNLANQLDKSGKLFSDAFGVEASHEILVKPSQ